MQVTLNLGDRLDVCFAETDGTITVAFGPEAVTVKADMPDAEGREGVIYCEPFGVYSAEDLAAKEQIAQADQFHGMGFNDLIDCLYKASVDEGRFSKDEDDRVKKIREELNRRWQATINPA